MRLSTLKDLFVVASLFIGVGFAGTSVVQAVQEPATDSAAMTAVCSPPSSVVTLSPDTPTNEVFLCS